MMTYLMMMYRHQMLTEEDLDGFSEEVRTRLAEFQRGLAQPAGGCDDEKSGS